jgi:hypothetical protein
MKKMKGGGMKKMKGGRKDGGTVRRQKQSY